MASGFDSLSANSSSIGFCFDLLSRLGRCHIKMGRMVGKSSMNDVVKNPSHYCEGREYEPKDVIRDWNLNFNLGNVIKYISRAGRKDDIVQDLKKARQYLDFEIMYLEEQKLKEYLETHNEKATM